MENTLASVGQIALHRKPFPNWVPPQHWHAEIYDVTVPRGFYDLGFLVCRNPYLRFVSEFRHRARDADVLAVGLDTWAAKILDSYAADPYVLYNHIRPQNEFWTKGIEIFRFEVGLQACIDKLADYCCLSKAPNVRRDNLSPRVAVTMSRATAERIALLYKRDFALFNYDAKDLGVLERSGVTLT